LLSHIFFKIETDVLGISFHFIVAGQFLKRSAMLVINQDPAVHLVGKARAPAQSSTPAVAREMISGMVTVFLVVCYIEPGSLSPADC
jgi:hypothetical protein